MNHVGYHADTAQILIYFPPAHHSLLDSSSINPSAGQTSKTDGAAFI